MVQLQLEGAAEHAPSQDAALAPLAGSRRYLNYLDNDDTGAGALTAAYGANLPRLQSIKAKYDPTNLFRVNQNIKPA